MRKNILRVLALGGLFLFASVQLLPLVGALALGFELFPHWPVLAAGMGLLLYGCCFAGLLWLERKDLFNPREKKKERLSTWLIALGLNALVESVALLFFNMIVFQPLASWLNGTFQVEELGLSFLFLILLIAGVVVVTFFSWLLSQSGKTERTKK